VRVNRLRLASFRNFDQDEVAFSAGTNLLVGRNGQGKTNLLEAIYFLGYGRSFRTTQPRECIRHGAGSAAVGASIEEGTSRRELGVEITPGQKRLLVNGKEAALEEFVGKLHVLAFTSEHLRIVRGAPADRRAFLDRAMVAVYPGHLRRLAAYGRALRQRNELLRRAGARGDRPEGPLLESWDEKLAADGVRIQIDRQRFAASMREVLHGGFAGDDLDLRYAATVDAGSLDPAVVGAAFRVRLGASRAAELRAGHTLVGPHRDDLRLTLGGKALDRYGSAGQQRSALLGLYFAQMEVHRATHGSYPIFLLDDVEAELDTVRLGLLLDHLAERTQTFLTTAKETLVPALRGAVARYHVEAGTTRSEPVAIHDIN
jgi:DNA replication and repair protein RecF